MKYRMNEPSIIRGTQKHADAIKTQRSASCKCGEENCNCGISPIKYCELTSFLKHPIRHTREKIKNSLWDQKRKKKKAKRDKIKNERKRVKNNKNTGWSNSRTLPSPGSSKINEYTDKE